MDTGTALPRHPSASLKKKRAGLDDDRPSLRTLPGDSSRLFWDMERRKKRAGTHYRRIPLPPCDGSQRISSSLGSPTPCSAQELASHRIAIRSCCCATYPEWATALPT